MGNKIYHVFEPLREKSIDFWFNRIFPSAKDYYKSVMLMADRRRGPAVIYILFSNPKRETCAFPQSRSFKEM